MPFIIPFFMMHRGCPHRCIYCNQRTSGGACPEEITPSFFRDTVASHLNHRKRKPAPVQIAFYGGNFTGMPKQDQRRMLDYAQPFLQAKQVDGIRISTRPDYIDEETLRLLKDYGVQTVELGVQSMADDILAQALRGHSAEDVRAAVKLLKAYGFQTGIHLMAGLPGEDRDRFAYSVEETIALQPEMVRIHPTLVFNETLLADAFREGRYAPLSLQDAIDWCKPALERFDAAGIAVIRVGLQTNPEMEKAGTLLAGPYHPAFRSLVMSSLFFDKASALLSGRNWEGRQVLFSLSPKDLSFFRGQKNENIRKLQERFGLREVRTVSEPARPGGTLHAGVMA